MTGEGTTALVVRAATQADAAAISALAREVQALHAAAHPDIFRPAGPDVFPPAMITSLLARDDYDVLVATTADGEFAGYACASLHEQPASPWKHAARFVYLEQMGVEPTRRGTGVGTRLLAAVREAARARGVAEVRLEVWAFNSGARAFWERHGFAPYQLRMRSVEE